MLSYFGIRALMAGYSGGDCYKTTPVIKRATGNKPDNCLVLHCADMMKTSESSNEALSASSQCPNNRGGS